MPEKATQTTPKPRRTNSSSKNRTQTKRKSKKTLISPFFKTFLILLFISFVTVASSYFILPFAKESNFHTSEKVVHSIDKKSDIKIKELYKEEQKKFEEQTTELEKTYEHNKNELIDTKASQELVNKINQLNIEKYAEEERRRLAEIEKLKHQKELQEIEKQKEQRRLEEELKRIQEKKELEKRVAKEKLEKERQEREKLQKEKKAKEQMAKNQPMIAIVIDDVTTRSQVRAMQNVGYPINMSFLPPTKHHPNSAKIAKNISFHMIHFPMQASSFKFEEENTLHIGDSYEKIENRVKKLREWYPNAIYTNNHTGSKFTENLDGMDKLYRALKKYNFVFVDSRTTSKTVAKEMARKYNMPYYSRNIFLDNKHDFEYIQGQLKKAIYIAKKSGFAMAIGHPHKITIDTLKKSKYLLEGLNIVYVDKLPPL